jgi:transcriptional regulator with XRE-family HTH domain
MTSDDFMNASLSKLASITNIDKPRWSRYLNGKVSPNYRTLEKAAKELGMSTINLLECLEKRKQYDKKSPCCA